VKLEPGYISILQYQRHVEFDVVALCTEVLWLDNTSRIEANTLYFPRRYFPRAFSEAMLRGTN
jgi:hypothetical protein